MQVLYPWKNQTSELLLELERKGDISTPCDFFVNRESWAHEEKIISALQSTTRRIRSLIGVSRFPTKIFNALAANEANCRSYVERIIVHSAQLHHNLSNFADLLQHTPNLRVLSLILCDLEDVDVEVLLEGLRTCTSLEKLDLSGNLISSETLRTLRDKVFPLMPNLRHLSINANHFIIHESEPEECLLQSCLAVLPNLLVLAIRRVPLGNSGLCDLLSGLSRKIRALHIDYCNIENFDLSVHLGPFGDLREW